MADVMTHLAAAAVDDVLLVGRNGRVGRAEEGDEPKPARLACRPVLHDHDLLRHSSSSDPAFRLQGDGLQGHEVHTLHLGLQS